MPEVYTHRHVLALCESCGATQDALLHGVWHVAHLTRFRVRCEYMIYDIRYVEQLKPNIIYKSILCTCAAKQKSARVDINKKGGPHRHKVQTQQPPNPRKPRQP